MTRTIELQSMRDSRGRWHAMACLPAYVKRRTKQHDYLLRSALGKFTGTLIPETEAIIGDGFIWKMQEDYKPLRITWAGEVPNFNGEWSANSVKIDVIQHRDNAALVY